MATIRRKTKETRIEVRAAKSAGPSADVRVDKSFRIGGAELVVYLDVLNVLNRPIAEEVLWDPTYTRQGYISGLPIVADLGLRGAW
jgi:hypothetical protein